MELLAEQPSDSVTAVKIPQSLKNKKIIQKVKDRDYIVAGGQGKLKENIFRISHLGYYKDQDLLNLLCVLESVLIESGWNCKPGLAVSKFQEEFHSIPV